MAAFFNFLSATVSLYTTLCFVRIILTWIPGLNFSKAGQILSAICDPWLNLFRKIPFKIGGLDFTPMISIGILTLVSSLLKNIAATGRLYVGGIIANIIMLAWSIFSSIVSVFFVALIIRLIVMAFSKKSSYYDSPWSRFDNAINPFVYKICRPFTKGKSISYKNALIIAVVASGIILLAGNILMGFIINLIAQIPF